MRAFFLFLILLALASVSACSTVLTTRAADQVAELVVRYCEEEGPEFRKAYRETFNQRLPTNHSVTIECPGDLP